MEDLLTTLIAPLVTDIKKIDIEKIQEERGIRFIVHIPKDEIAKVIGKEGKMVKAIKNLMKVRAIKDNVFVNVEVVEA
ncbi:KH domain-containing protein [Candidatus Curtissbacteria bacterium]|nr:KH domain-containing protein [Candidatus Curtissbacteria bacterium]